MNKDGGNQDDLDATKEKPLVIEFYYIYIIND